MTRKIHADVLVIVIMAKQVRKVATEPPGNLTIKKATTKVTKPAPKGKLVKTRKDGTPRSSTSDIFGPDAPSRKLRLAQAGRLTAAEQVTFLPHWLRSHDVLHRFVQNGADAHTLAKIINYNRRSTKSYGAVDNSLCKLMQNTMRERGYAGWTISKHITGLFKQDDEVWDEDNLTLTGGKVHCEDFPDLKRHGGPPVDNVRFASLANDIQVYPSEDTGDALDLTRCVKYAVANRHIPLQFPRDFVYLTDLTGGPRPVTNANLDREVFKRWNKVKKGSKPDHEQEDIDIQHYGFTVAQEVDVVLYLSQFSVDGHVGEANDPDRLHEIQDRVIPQPHGDSATFQDCFRHPPAFVAPVLPTNTYLAHDMGSTDSGGLAQRNAQDRQAIGHSGDYNGQQQFIQGSYGDSGYNLLNQDELKRQSRASRSRQESIHSATRPSSTVASSPDFAESGFHNIEPISTPIEFSPSGSWHDQRYHVQYPHSLSTEIQETLETRRGTHDFLTFGDLGDFDEFYSEDQYSGYQA